MSCQKWLYICLQITDEDAEYLGQIHKEDVYPHSATSLLTEASSLSMY